MNFEKWLEEVYIRKNGKRISEASVKKYFNAIHTISEDMLKQKVIDKNLEGMDLFQLDIAIEKILKNKDFSLKDTTGNRMYSCALKRYRCYKYFFEDKILETYNRKTTESEIITKNRIGQQTFKNQLLKKYNNSCIITNLSLSPVLIASHIKPWSISSNTERIDVDNGLLLSATYDKLFDSGLITFKENGELLISDIIDDNSRKKLGLVAKTKYDIKVNGKMKEYLKYHNDIIFVK